MHTQINITTMLVLCARYTRPNPPIRISVDFFFCYLQRLGPKVPPLCQFLEEPSNDHRLRYRSRKHEHWRLSFDIDGRPRTFCPPRDRNCRLEHRQTRNHRQCNKFSFSVRVDYGRLPDTVYARVTSYLHSFDYQP